MSMAGSGAFKEPMPLASPTALGSLFLTRIACNEGVTRAELIRDLTPFFSHKLSPADWRRMTEVQMGLLVASGYATETRGRLHATDLGEKSAAAFLGTSGGNGDWNQQRDVGLIAKALGIEKEPAAKLKSLMRQDSLRGLIVQVAYGLPLKKNQPPAKIRAQLAIIALERAFGNKIKTGFSERSGLPAKAGRMLAGQLAKTPKDFGTDTRLIAELAAEFAGAVETDTDSLRAALLKGLGTRVLEARPPTSPITSTPRMLQPAANDAAPSTTEPVLSPRPDLGQFAAKVLSAARSKAEGWPGNRKAYISQVWTAIRATNPEWSLSEIEFKCMLAEAHRAGKVMLANADLKDKKALTELESSAITYKNTVWHYVRVED